MRSVSWAFLPFLVVVADYFLVRRLDRARKSLERQLQEVAVEID